MSAEFRKKEKEKKKVKKKKKNPLKRTAIWQNLHEKLDADGRRTDVLHQLTRGNDGTLRKSILF